MDGAKAAAAATSTTTKAHAYATSDAESSLQELLHHYKHSRAGLKTHSRGASKRNGVLLDAPSRSAAQALTLAQMALRTPPQPPSHRKKQPIRSNSQASAASDTTTSSIAANASAADALDSTDAFLSSSSLASSPPRPPLYPSSSLDSKNTLLAPLPPSQRLHALALASALSTSNASAWAPSWGLSPVATYSTSTSGRPGPNFG